MPRSRLRRELPLALGAVVLAGGLLTAAGAAHGDHRASSLAETRSLTDVGVAQHRPSVAPSRADGGVAQHGSAGSTAHRPWAHPAVEPGIVPAMTQDNALETKLRDRLSRATSDRFSVVVNVDGLGEVANIGGGLSMMPASTQKLFTTLPVLLHQPARRLVTTVAAGVAPQGGVVRGNLVVHAAGDPSLLRRDLVALAQQTRHAGIRRVTGRLLLDIGGLSLRTRSPGWKWDFVPADVGPLSPFPVGSDQLGGGAWYLAHPTLGNLGVFREIFRRNGVHVAGVNAIVRSSHPALVVATHTSRPLMALVGRTLRLSDNFWAESLLTVEGNAAVTRVVSAANVRGANYATDGSGLSYLDRQTAVGEVTLLRFAENTAPRRLLRLLPVACRSGTLIHEFCGTAAAGAVFAKTGTLDHAKALSGYTTDAKGRLVTFAILCNDVRDTYRAELAIQRAVLVLRYFAG